MGACYSMRGIIHFMQRLLHKLCPLRRQASAQDERQKRIDSYIRGGHKPWSPGYQESKFDFIRQVLNDPSLMARFLKTERLPQGFGYGYDERVVEYPWVMTRLANQALRLLDAGSVFNYQEIIDHPKIANKKFTIFTLAPERNAFWQRGISYEYGDLRELPFRDNWFDEIISLSTLGHVGMDNRIYTKTETKTTIGLEAEKAVSELIRVLRPGGRFLISVVFGRHQLIEWNGSPFAEQFDRNLLDGLLESFSSCASVSTDFYMYTKDGWNVCLDSDCSDVEYFNIHTKQTIEPDNAAAARAVALIDVTK